MEDLVVEAFQMLDVHIGHHIDARIQQDLHVLPSLGAFRTRHIGVRQFIHDADRGPPHLDRGSIHLLQRHAPIIDGLRRDHFQSFGFCDGVLPFVRLEVADNNVLPLSFEMLRFLQHAIGLAHARRVAEQQLQLTSRRTRIATARPSLAVLALLGIDDDIDSFGGANEAVHQIAPEPPPCPL